MDYSLEVSVELTFDKIINPALRESIRKSHGELLSQSEPRHTFCVTDLNGVVRVSIQIPFSADVSEAIRIVPKYIIKIEMVRGHINWNTFFTWRVSEKEGVKENPIFFTIGI